MRSPAPQPHTGDLALYHFPTCPYCVRVFIALKRMGLKLEMRNIHRDPRRGLPRSRPPERERVGLGGLTSGPPPHRVGNHGGYRTAK